MSNPSDSAADEPEKVGDEQPVTEQPSSTENETQSERKTSGIRIGTQRWGVKPPPAVAQPVLPSPPQELLAKAAALSGRPQAAAETQEPANALSQIVEDTKAPPAARPGERRTKKPDLKPRDVKSPVEVAPRKYPPPNTRDQLSPDLELEYLAAVGGQSLEEILAESGTESLAELESESRHKAKVVSIHRENVFVEIGRQQGLVPLKNFAEPPEPGAVLDVVVSRFNAAEGLYELVLPGSAIDVADWSDVVEGMLVEARVTGHNKGGLECEVNRLRGFIPASQTSMYRVEDLAQFVGQAFTCVVTEANPEKRNLVLSRRAVLEREKAEAKEKLMASLEVGQVHEGLVRSLQPFGAFVDLGGIDGLVHISQLSWDRIKHPSEVLEVGQKVKVKVQKIDPQTGKLSLAFRDLSESPWSTAARDFPTHTKAKGTVTRLMEFGAFVRLGPGVEGLIHISELSHKRVFRVSDVVSEGQQLEVLVLSVDSEAQRISLSLKALEAKAQPVEEQKGQEESVEEAPQPEKVTKKRAAPLRGGIGGPSSGEKFGLKW
jgi:small subunit ribosomal protein S1